MPKNKRKNGHSLIIHVTEVTEVYVSEGSFVADHCSGHALSDSKDCEPRSYCSHDHSEKCSQCESLSDALCCIERYLAELKLTPEELDDL